MKMETEKEKKETIQKKLKRKVRFEAKEAINTNVRNYLPAIYKLIHSWFLQTHPLSKPKESIMIRMWSQSQMFHQRIKLALQLYRERYFKHSILVKYKLVLTYGLLIRLVQRLLEIQNLIGEKKKMVFLRALLEQITHSLPEMGRKRIKSQRSSKLRLTLLESKAKTRYRFKHFGMPWSLTLGHYPKAKGRCFWKRWVLNIVCLMATRNKS